MIFRAKKKSLIKLAVLHFDKICEQFKSFLNTYKQVSKFNEGFPPYVFLIVATYTLHQTNH